MLRVFQGLFFFQLAEGFANLSVALLPPAANMLGSGVFFAEVSWTSSFPNTSYDTISLHCADADAGAGASWPVPTPSGSFRTPLAHGVRCAFEFRYHRRALLGAPAAAALLAASARAPALGADNDPVGTRLAFGDAAGDIIFIFSSMTNSTADPAYVAYSLTPGGPYTNVSTEASSYAAEDLCHAPANTSGIASYLFPGYFHRAVLHLAPATRYFAVYGHRHGAPAPETSFRTRAPPAPDTPTRFAAFGDSALYPVFPGTVTTIDNINAVDADVGPVRFPRAVRPPPPARIARTSLGGPTARCRTHTYARPPLSLPPAYPPRVHRWTLQR
jgi:hypothetical protein